MIEMESVKFTKNEIVEILAKYTGVKLEKVTALIELLIKVGVISEFIFKEEGKAK